jgi:signal peptidase I
MSDSSSLNSHPSYIVRGKTLRMTVLGSSMWPFIRDEDVLTITPMNARAPQVGDIIAFVHPQTGRLTIHRVVAQTGEEWLLRGDNNRESDGIVLQKDFLGFITQIHRKGREKHFGLGVEKSLIAFLQRNNMLSYFNQLYWWAWRIQCRFASK